MDEKGQGRQKHFVSIETISFSGSTLLALLLGNHPQVATIGELTGLRPQDDPQNYLCSCGELIIRCPFWEAIKGELERRGEPFNFSDFHLRYRLVGPKRLQALRGGASGIALVDRLRDKILFSLPSERRKFKVRTERNIAFIESVLQVTGVEVFVDSAKDKFRAESIWRLSDFEVKVIHLVRRAEGVVYSHVRRGRTDVAMVSSMWLKKQRRIVRNLQQWPQSKVIRIRYEDVCKQPEETLDRLFSFIGVGENSGSLFPQEAHHVIGNPMRLRPLKEIRLNESWRVELREKEKAIVNKIAGPLNRNFGY